jgi:HEAT repeat protein
VSAALLLCLQLVAQADTDPHFLDLVDRLRDDERWKSRAESAMLLGRSRDIRARKPLTRALVDPHYAVRTAALRALAQLGDVRAVPDILDRISDEEAFVRVEAERSLDRFQLVEIRPYLINALRRHSSAAVRLRAAMLLANNINPATREALLDATGDAEEISRFAVSALRTLPEEQAAADFFHGLAHGDYKVQIACMRALADMEVPAAAERVAEMLDSHVPEVTLAAGHALVKLKQHLDHQKYRVAALRSKDPFERARALKVLGFIGGEEASLLLLNALDHPDVLVRGAAVGALTNLGDVRAIPKLREMRKNEENARIIISIRKAIANLERKRDGTPEKLTQKP